jgi:hypothetical protein
VVVVEASREAAVVVNLAPDWVATTDGACR